MSERTKAFNRDSNGVIQERLNVRMRRTPTGQRKRAPQRIFICVDYGRRGQFAIQVPCWRPTEHRDRLGTIEKMRNNGHQTRRVLWRKILSSERSCESDSDIVARMARKSKREVGTLVGLIPYYGVVKVEIVEFRLLFGYTGQARLPIAIKGRLNGSTIVKETLEQYDDATQLWDEVRSNDEGSGLCGYPEHLRKCPAAADPLLPCIASRPMPIGKRRGIREVCKENEFHNEECCPGKHGCIMMKNEWVEDVGKPGIRTFERLPELLRRPMDTNPSTLSKWMKREGLLHDVRALKKPGKNPASIRGRYTLRGIKVRIGWDFERLKVDLPCHLSLVWIVGSVVWLGVILWATETDDNNTAMAFGSLLLGFFNFLFFSSSTWKV